MAQHLDLEEQEQLDELKHFWNTWGTLISAALLVVFGTLAAWNGYQYWQKRQGVQASALVDALDGAATLNDTARMERIFTDLQSNYARTTQASAGGLQWAKAQVQSGRWDEAKATLTWVAHSGADTGHQAIARLRLAGILQQQKAYDQALKELSSGITPEFEGLAADRRGDIYALQGKKAQAIAAYEQAHQRLDENLEFRRLVEVKLNALGVQPQRVAGASTTESVK